MSLLLRRVVEEEEEEDDDVVDADEEADVTDPAVDSQLDSQPELELKEPVLPESPSEESEADDFRANLLGFA